MAKVLNQLPPYSVPKRHTRGWSATHGRFGPVISKLQSHRSPPRPFPSQSVHFPGNAPQAISNRIFRAWVSHIWKSTMTNAQRAAWAALAAITPVRDYSGNIETLSGFAFYAFFETTLRIQQYYPCNGFNPNAGVPHLDPPVAWTVPLDPTNLHDVAHFDQYLTLKFDTTSYGDVFKTWANVCSPNPTARTGKNKHFIWLGAFTAPAIAYPAERGALIDWTGILPVPPRPGLYTFRIRLIPDFSWTGITDWLEFQVRLP